MSNQNPNEFILNGLRLSFPNIWKAKAMKGGKPRFTVNLLADPKVPAEKKQILAVKKRIEEITKEAFNTDKKLPRDRTCLRKDDEPRWDGYEDKWYFTAARPETQGPPIIIDRGRQKLEPGSRIPYAGCYVNAKIRLYAQDYDGIKRVNASLEIVQFVKDGEPFGAGEADASDMPELEETDGLDDEGLDDGGLEEEDDDLA